MEVVISKLFGQKSMSVLQYLFALHLLLNRLYRLDHDSTYLFTPEESLSPFQTE